MESAFSDTFKSAACCMKEVQDHYFRRAKQEGYPARSVYKLEEAQVKYRLIARGNRVVDLGCRPGSWSLYASRVVGPAGLVVGVDLSDGKPFPREKEAAPIAMLRADILDPATLENLREFSSVYDVIVSDMAPRTTGSKFSDQQHSVALARRVLEIAAALLRPGGNWYCKIFEGEDVREVFQEVRRLFRAAKMFKPKSSRPESREVFILGLGYAPAPEKETCNVKGE